MKAMILAAGEGRRMRPLTLNTPKPLLTVGDKPLIQHHIERLKLAGIREFVVNVSYLADQIMDFLGTGERLGVCIEYSVEEQMLETAGAIHRAQPILGDAPFLLINGDIWIDYDFSSLVQRAPSQAFHLVLMDNPAHNPKGDFVLNDGRVSHLAQGKTQTDELSLTFAGLSVIDPVFFHKYPKCREKFPLKEVLDWAIDQGQVSGERHLGHWVDVGTPERLEQVRRGY